MLYSSINSRCAAVLPWPYRLISFDAEVRVVVLARSIGALLQLSNDVVRSDLGAGSVVSINIVLDKMLVI